MGIYVNPGNESFAGDSQSEIYVDKTGLIRILNERIGTTGRYISVSRPRRFGKSMAAGMVAAYYSRGCDSHSLFAPYIISSDAAFETHLNKYNVLWFDVSEFLGKAKDVSATVDIMNNALLRELIKLFPEAEWDGITYVPDALAAVHEHTGIRFIIIIDEWDCIIRDQKENEQLILSYLRYLRSFFKTEKAKGFLALAYITGILPIRKMEGESAMNVFEEFTMTSPDILAPYFGFTEEEVEFLCGKYGMDIGEIREWYDGYLMYLPVREQRKSAVMRLLHIYNPNSLVLALQRGRPDYFWRNTGAFRGLNVYIERNLGGLKDAVVKMLSGEDYPVDIHSFQNDLTSFRSKHDVLAALIHMGYLGYDSEKEMARIPNKEVRAVFESAVKAGEWSDVQDALRHADELLDATLRGDGRSVAEAVRKSQQDYASIITLHDESSLATAIMMSYYTARSYYDIRRELPGGRGFADIVFLPKPGIDKPAIVVELKWNRSARAAIRQIHDRDYAGALSAYKGEFLLVGINYTKKTGKYSCRIERDHW